jgi:hypothetical protein
VGLGRRAALSAVASHHERPLCGALGSSRQHQRQSRRGTQIFRQTVRRPRSDRRQHQLPSGEFATGGGISGGAITQSANASYPLLDPATGHDDGWVAFMDNTGTAAATFNVYVICAPATSVTP